MAHNQGNEYQVRIVREDGIEELSGWMNSAEQVAQTMLVVDRPQGKTYWLLVRPSCSDQGTDFGISPYACPVSTVHPARLPLPGGGGVGDRCALDFSASAYAVSSGAGWHNL